MSRTSTLITLLRVRRVQEDVARASAASAHADAASARDALAVRELALDRHRLPDGAAGTAYVAAMSAARAMAADASAARILRDQRDDVVQRAIAHWAETRARADAVAEGVAREEAEVDAEAERVEQNARDDASTAAWLRRRRDEESR